MITKKEIREVLMRYRDLIVESLTAFPPSAGMTHVFLAIMSNSAKPLQIVYGDPNEGFPIKEDEYHEILFYAWIPIPVKEKKKEIERRIDEWIESIYPGVTTVQVTTPTKRKLDAYKISNGFSTYEETIRDLLEKARKPGDADDRKRDK